MILLFSREAAARAQLTQHFEVVVALRAQTPAAALAGLHCWLPRLDLGVHSNHWVGEDGP